MGGKLATGVGRKTRQKLVSFPAVRGLGDLGFFLIAGKGGWFGGW